jgi:hypothetical protein
MSDFLTKEETALMSSIANLRNQLFELEAALSLERMKRAGVKVGDIVTRRGEDYRVCEVEPPSMSGKAWVRGNPRKKDGTFGTAVRALYSDWTMKEPA